MKCTKPPGRARIPQDKIDVVIDLLLQGLSAAEVIRHPLCKCSSHGVYKTFKEHAHIAAPRRDARGRPSSCARNLPTFWENVSVGKIEACWDWAGYIRPNGYAYCRLTRLDGEDIGVRAGTHPAHRIAFLLYFGALDDKMTVDHICHNPRCCNPAHLRLCTHSENAKRRWHHVMDSRPQNLPIHATWAKPKQKAPDSEQARGNSPTARDGNGGRDGSQDTRSA